MFKKPDTVIVSDADIYCKSMSISWGANIGFGQLHGHVDEESGILHFDSENMGKTFIKAVFEKLIENSVVDDFQTVSKTTKSISLEEVNALQLAGVKHFLHTPYLYKYENEETKETIQLFWNLDDNKKCKVIIKNNEDDEDFQDIVSYAIKVRNDGFCEEFISAEMIEYIITDKPKKT